MNKVDKEVIKNIRNLILAWVSLNPRHRPSVKKILKYRLFGGSLDFAERVNDVWRKKASIKKINFLLFLFIGQGANLTFASKYSCYSQNGESSSSVSELDADQVNVSVTDVHKPHDNLISVADAVESSK